MHIALRRIGAPSAEPITLAEARAHLRVDGTAEDAMIALYMAAAREVVEQETGRCLMPTDWVMDLPGFPADGMIEPWHAPLISLTSISTVSAAGTVTALAAGAWQVAIPAGPAALRGQAWPAASTTWPSTDIGVAAPVRVQYRAGYASVSNVPAALRAAVLLALGDLFANREAASVARVSDNPAFGRLIAPYRLFWG